MSDQRFIEVAETIVAPSHQIFSAFTSSVALESWFSDFTEVDFKEKGRLYCWWNVGYFASGIFTKIVENKYLAFTWSGPDEPHGTDVEISLTPMSDIPKAYAPEVDLTKVEITEVTIKHSGIGPGSEWSERISAYKKGWQTGLINLKSVLETGIDQRMYDRPMLGIIPGDLIDENKAEELGLPFKSGLILAGTVTDMGAEAAGLQQNDIIVSLNKHELTGYQSLTSALAGCKAGDQVEVIYYRMGDKNTILMELSRRQLPEVTQSATEFGEFVAKTYQEVAKERESIFKDVSDSESKVRPAPNSWSAKEILVHLLYTERWLHFAISCAVSEQRTGGFANQLDLIAAMANVYTLKELLAELRRSEEVTIATLKALPDEFVTDKRKFYRLAYGPGQGYAWHTRSHFDQIKAAIAAARTE